MNSNTLRVLHLRALALGLAFGALTALFTPASSAADPGQGPGPAGVPAYSRLIVFGDGLSDQGMFGRLTGNRYPPSPPFFEGRWTNGLTWVEHLARKGAWPLTAADNHAQGGATTGRYNINEPLRGLLQLGPDAPIRGVLAQIEAVAASGQTLDPKALYVVWAGGHDIGAYLEFGQPDLNSQPPEDNIRAGLKLLQRAGARHVLLGTMPDMSATPGYAGTELGARAKALVDAYNRGLAAVASDMRGSGLGVTLLDGSAAFARAGQASARLGIRHFSEAYLPLDYVDFRQPLAPAKPLPAGRDANAYFSFWAVSASAKVHEVIAEAAFDTLTTTGATAIALVDLNRTRRHPLHGGPGQVAFLAASPEGIPDAAQISLRRGQVQPPYASDDGRARLATVLRGQLHFGQGPTPRQTLERIVKPGQTIVIPPGTTFWVAARTSPVDILIQVLPKGSQVGAATTPLR